MGAVYRAWHINLNIAIAIKEMVPQSDLDPHTLAQLRHQFQQEATVLARLDHPHLVRVTDFFEEGGNTYLVMDFVEGENLADRIEREGPLPEPQVLKWADQLLDALAYCHAEGVLHRDVKPQNVILRPDGRAVLVDFGLVKLWDPRDPRTRTAMRGMGTPEYAPPEQHSTQPGHTDPRSDLYGLGATLYHTLAGQAPQTASERMAFPDQFLPVRTLNPSVSGETEAAVLKAMELPVVNRFQSAAEMSAALRGRSPAPARPAAPKRKPTKVMPGAGPAAPPRKRVPVWAWALGGVAVVAMLALGVALALGAMDGGTATQVSPTAAPATGALTEPPPTEPPLTLAAVPTATPAGPSLRDTWTRPADGMVMVYVPAGEFEMGSTEGDSDEQPVHTVALDGFWMDQTEVTNGQFVVFLNEQGNQTEGSVAWLDLGDRDCLIEWSGAEPRPKSGYDNHPVIEVSWYGAATYCEWAGARLPTEAEWEYTARGSQGFTYPWGNGAPTCELAQFGQCSGRTAPAGSLPDGASWCGALDLAGNVWEWVADWYDSDYYGRSPSRNPAGPSSGESRVPRGGSWFNFPFIVRSTNRHAYHPDETNDYVGFRCARDSE